MHQLTYANIKWLGITIIILLSFGSVSQFLIPNNPFIQNAYALEKILQVVQVTNPSVNSDECFDVAHDGGTAIYIACVDRTIASTNGQWFIEKRSTVDLSQIWQQTINPTSGDDFPLGIAVDSAGVYVVGAANGVSTSGQWYIVKLSISNGSLLNTVNIDPSTSLLDVAVDVVSDGTNIYVAGISSLTSSNTQWRIEKRSNSNLSLVTAFDGDGILQVNPTSNHDRAFAITYQSGVLYIGGDDAIPASTGWRMQARNATNGSLIWTQSIDPTTSSDMPADVIADATGVYFVGCGRGTIGAGTSPSTPFKCSDAASVDEIWYMTKRSLADGAELWTQTFNGSTSTTVDEFAHSVAQDDSYIYILGQIFTDGEWLLQIRDKATGGLVSSFQSDPSSADDAGYGVVLDVNGIYMVGSDRQTTNSQYRVEKRLYTEYSDNVWFVNIDPTTSSDFITDMVIDGSGLYVVGCGRGSIGAGTSASTPFLCNDAASVDEIWYMTKRSLANGAELWTQTFNDSTSTAVDESANAVAVDANYVYVAGISASNMLWRVQLRDKGTGALQNTYTNDVSAGDDALYGIALDSTYMYLAGSDAQNTNLQYRVEKVFLANLTLAASTTANPSSNADELHGIAIDGSSLYTCGIERSIISNNGQWSMQRRAASNLSVTWGTLSNPTTGDDACMQIKVDSSGVYFGGRTGGSDPKWHIEKRNKSDGALIWQIDTNLSPATDHAISMEITAEGLYLAGWDSFHGVEDTRWRLEKYSLSDGSLVYSVLSKPTSNNDLITAIAVDSTYVYLGGTENNQANWRIESRFAVNGTGFGGGGGGGAPPSSTAPIVTSFDDDPDIVNYGAIVNFIVGWQDIDDSTIRAHICKTNAITPSATGGFCTDGNWVSTTSFVGSNPLTISYTTTIADVGTKSYFVFVCDNDSQCSITGVGSSFDVIDHTGAAGGVPQRTSFSLQPSILDVNNNVTITTNWSDNDDTEVKVHVCKTNSITPSPSGGFCTSGTWVASASFDSSNPIILMYNATSTDIGTNNVYIFVCDNDSQCSSTTNNFATFIVTVGGGTKTISLFIYDEFDTVKFLDGDYDVEVHTTIVVKRFSIKNGHSINITVSGDIDKIRLWRSPNTTSMYWREQLSPNPAASFQQFNFFMAKEDEHAVGEYRFFLQTSQLKWTPTKTIWHHHKVDDSGNTVLIESQLLDSEWKVLPHLVRGEVYKHELHHIDTGETLVFGDFKADVVLDKFFTPELKRESSGERWIVSHSRNANYTTLFINVTKAITPFDLSIRVYDLIDFDQFYNFTGANDIDLAVSVLANRTYYVAAYTNDVAQFTFFDARQSLGMAGFSGFNSLGTVFGIEIANLFPLLLGAVALIRNTYAFFLILIIAIGIMGYIGLITVENWAWSLMGVVVAVGVMTGRKFA